MKTLAVGLVAFVLGWLAGSLHDKPPAPPASSDARR